MNVRHLLATGGTALSLLLSACGPAPAPAPEPKPSSSIDPAFLLLVEANLTPLDQALLKNFPKAHSLALDHPIPKGQSAAKLWVIPDASRSSSALYNRALQGIRSGHSVLIGGARPFERALPLSPGLWTDPMSPQEFKPKETGLSLSDLPFWEPHQKDERILSEIRRLSVDFSERTLYQLRFLAPQGSQRFITSPPADLHSSTGLQWLCRTPATGTPYLLTAIHSNGDRHHALIPCHKEWTRIRILPQAFRAESSAPPLSAFADVESFELGFDTVQRPVDPEAQIIELSGIYSWQPGEDKAMESSFPLRNPAASYAVEVERIRTGPAEEEQLFLHPLWIRSPLPLRSSSGRQAITPLLYAVNRQETSYSLLTRIRDSREGDGAWLWTGAPIQMLPPDVQNLVIQTASQDLQTPQPEIRVFAPARFHLAPGEPIACEILLALPPNSPDNLRIKIELLSEQGELVSDVHSDPLRNTSHPDLNPISLTLPGITPLEKIHFRYQLRARLYTPSRPRQALDEAHHWIHIFPKSEAADEQFFLHANANIFRIGRNGFALNSLDYTPSWILPESQDWSDPACFFSSRFEEDMKQLASAGINTLRFRIPSWDHPSTLRYAIDTAANNGLLSIVQLPYVNPYEHIEFLRDYFKQSGILDAPQTVSIEMDTDFRRDPDWPQCFLEGWNSWLEEQFASNTFSEALFEAPPIDLLPDVSPDSPRFALLQAYANDWASRRLRALIDSLDRLGVKQMISARFPRQPARPAGGEARLIWDFRAAAPHVDYLTLSAEEYSGYGNRRDDLVVSQTRIARALSGGKPIVWENWSLPMLRTAAPEVLANQAEDYRERIAAFGRAKTAGFLGPPVWDVDSPMLRAGLWLSPYTPSPANEIFKVYSNTSRGRRILPIPWRDRRIDLDARGARIVGPGGVPDSETDGEEEIRHRDYRVPTTKMDMSPLGGIETAPPSSVNAQWGDVFDGDRFLIRRKDRSLAAHVRQALKLTLVNTGMATWPDSVADQLQTVWIEVRGPDLKPRYLPVARTAFGET